MHGLRFLVLGLAIGVHGLALAAVHAAMGQIFERESLALQRPVRVVVIGQRSEPPIAAVRNCPAPQIL